MQYENLLIEIKNKVAIVSVNRPDKLNALNIETINELKEAFTHINGDKNIFVVILTGSGEKAFVAGADISELNKLDVESAKKFSENGQTVFNLIEDLDKPVIAAVNGFALGGGCELALACHIRIASENARFGQPEVNLGIIPGYGGTQRLTRLINSGRAMEYILTGDMIDANEALRIGLVNKIYPQPELFNKAVEMAEKIASKGQFAIRQSLKCVNIVDEVTGKQGLDFEAAAFALCCGTKDFQEGTTTFLEKRKPSFTNE
ncbi:MAG: enoyl-CoA hydratase/isomerase family protein [Ignavibacteriales bacterium]|nr:MAG: enoyl-CoA hydratase/isomerase family protein [Ignavibacteriales bacterium]